MDGLSWITIFVSVITFLVQAVKDQTKLTPTQVRWAGILLGAAAGAGVAADQGLTGITQILAIVGSAIAPSIAHDQLLQSNALGGAIKNIGAGVTSIVQAVLTPSAPPGIDEPPSLPAVYSGKCSINGSPAPDGCMVQAQVVSPDGKTFWTSNAIATIGGSYANLTVYPPKNYAGQKVSFFVNAKPASADREVLWHEEDWSTPANVVPNPGDVPMVNLTLS